MTLAQEAIRTLGGDWHGRYGLAPAPGHSPRDRGVSIRDSSDGRDIVINSFNGADWRQVRDDLRGRGLALPEQGRATDEWRETGLFEFADEAGEILYRTRRLEHPTKRKRFVAERPDGRGGWAAKLGEVRRVLYRLPELSAAIGRAALKDEALPLVYLTEGERKADKLAAMGFLATAIAFGARGGIGREEYVEALRGCRVVILPDNDDEGRGFAEAARSALEKVGTEATILELPGLPDKGDVIDWTGTADDLRALTDAALNPPVAMFPLLDPGAWQGQHVPARQWALHEWIPARQATYLTGAGSAGKSLAAQQLATCIALGRSFLGVETRQAMAIYVTCEDDADELHRRQANICDMLGVPLSALSGKLHLVSLAGAIGNELATFDPLGRMATSPAWAKLRATVLATGAGFVALDNVAHLFAGNENIRNQVAAFCGLLNNLAAEADASVLFIGHPNKAGDSFSGSTAWENQVRSRIFLDRPCDTDGSVLDPDARTLSRAKANYARNGEALSFRWHQWAFVREDDLPPNVGAELSATIQANAENARFLKCLAKATEERRATSPNRTASNYAPRMFAAMTIGRGISERGFEAAMERLLHLRTIRNGERVYQRDNRAWVTGIGLAPTLAPTPAQTLARERTEPPETGGESCTNLHALTPLDTTYLPGPGHEAAEPDDDGEGIALDDHEEEE